MASPANTAHPYPCAITPSAASVVAWLPESSVTQDLANGQLVHVGGRDRHARMTISLFCSPEKLDETGRMIWESVPEIA